MPAADAPMDGDRAAGMVEDRAGKSTDPPPWATPYLTVVAAVAMSLSGSASKIVTVQSMVPAAAGL